MEFFDTTITDEAKELVRKCLDSERVSEGRLVSEFERTLETRFGYSQGVAVNSGTSALHLALILAGVGKNDEVILPAQTFIATGLAVLYCKAFPVFADIQVHTGNIDPMMIVNKITRRTKAIVAVAWGGMSPELETLASLCKMYGLKLIVDNAHALGAKVQHEDFSCFSFQAIKQLTTGDGGLLVCKDKADYERAKKLRWFGIDRERDLPDETGERQYNLWEIGYKYHMNDLSAAVGLGNLWGYDFRQEIRHRVADYYEAYLPAGITLYRKGSTDWLYTVLVNRRSEFIQMMKSKNIPVSVVHLGIHHNEVFGHRGKLHAQEHWDKYHVCLPCHSRMNIDDAERVVDAVRGGW